MSECPALRTPHGRVIALPVPFAVGEFTLAGNAFTGERLVALYDGATQSGAMFQFALPRWVIWQPVERAEFFALVSALDALGAAEAGHQEPAEQQRNDFP